MMEESTIRERIGTRIREARTRRGLKQHDIKEGIGLHPNTLRRYEQGETNIPLYRLIKLADYLDQPLAWFLQDIGEDQKLVLNKTEVSAPMLDWIHARAEGGDIKVTVDLNRLLASNVELVVNN